MGTFICVFLLGFLAGGLFTGILDLLFECRKPKIIHLDIAFSSPRDIHSVERR